MTDPMTPERLAEIEARANAATEGPWIAEYSGEQGDCVIPHDAHSTREAVAVCRLHLRAFDADFIAAARTDVPALVAEVRRLQAAVERVRELHRAVGIYDACKCTDDEKEAGHTDVEAVGLTCNKLYDICAECCRDDVYQTETCADHHGHRLGDAHHCQTIAALDGES